MDYKNMDTKELLQMISEQVSKEEINEGDKLIIQNVLKELFEKKCEKYKKVHYTRTKLIQDDDELELSSSKKVRIMEYIPKRNDDRGIEETHFPLAISKAQIEEIEETGCLIYTWCCDGVCGTNHQYTIYKVEDIEL
tara:strand:+ start:1030 stop:1440 length:411 start_codon:yes stop_codon:yes gene_type:complete